MAGYPSLTTIPSQKFRSWRFAAIRLALRHENATLIQPPEAKSFDPAEQAALSSLLGITVTKLLVENLLNAPILLFLDVHFQLAFPAPREMTQPDFAARNLAGQWFSVESKGMTRFRQATFQGSQTSACAGEGGWASHSQKRGLSDEFRRWKNEDPLRRSANPAAQIHQRSPAFPFRSRRLLPIL